MDLVFRRARRATAKPAGAYRTTAKEQFERGVTEKRDEMT